MSSISLPNVPSAIGVALGIGAFAGGILISLILMLLILLPINLVAKLSGWVNLVITFMVMGFCVAIGWMPITVMLVIVLITAGLYAVFIRKWLSG